MNNVVGRLRSNLGGRFARLDLAAVVATAGLALIGLVMAWINTRSYEQPILGTGSIFTRSLLWTALGIAIYSVVAFSNWRWVRTFAWPLYFANLLLLIVTLVYGEDSGGNARALAILGVPIQSSELAKVLCVVALATVLSHGDRERSGGRDILLTALVVFPPFLLVALQPDMGTALVLAAALFGALFLSGVATRWIALLGALAGSAFPATWVLFVSDYQKQRILAFIDPNADPAGPRYQLFRSLEAIAGGGLFGIGFDGTALANPLPVQESDFVFAALVRSFGFVAGGLVIGLIGLLVARLVWHAWTAPDTFGIVLAGGLAAVILFQAIVNIGMNLGIAPITGIPLPFVSYGGASFVSLALGLGLVQSHRVHGGATD